MSKDFGPVLNIRPFRSSLCITCMAKVSSSQYFYEILVSVFPNYPILKTGHPTGFVEKIFFQHIKYQKTHSKSLF